MAAVSARKKAELERAADWNVCQSCLSMRSSKMAIEVITLAEVIVIIMRGYGQGGDYCCCCGGKYVLSVKNEQFCLCCCAGGGG